MNQKIVIALIIGVIIGAGFTLAATQITPEKGVMLSLEEFMEMDKEQLIKYKDKTNAELKIIECLNSPAFFAFENPKLLPPGLKTNPCIGAYNAYIETQ